VYRRWGKRLLDIGVSGIILVVISPLFACVALGIWLTLGTPILFRQQRPGRGGASFWILKFRTMSDDRRADGHLLSDEKRLGRAGRMLRRLSLDELPELLNVLAGQMSLVGPRPLLMNYLDLYSPEQARRHEVLPGVTGWAQVNGRNALSWEERFEHDVWYVDNYGLWLDLRIIWRTVFSVLTMRGINAEGHATMPEFSGTDHG